ncbi:MAG: hypothetical protein HC811_00715 [Flammeovirgaceae bacterium]|nr:hypothetical protein [Flammeovirgaceae bacterium]
MEQHKPTRFATNTFEGLDLEKLSVIFRKNILWFAILFIGSNLAAYLYIRYTKDVYEAESEMKLDIKEDASELGIISYVEDNSLNQITGEIEQIRSKVFINHLIDHLDIDISYFSEGQVLIDEMYRRSPYEVTYEISDSYYFDKPIYIELKNDTQYSIRIGKEGSRFDGEFLKPLKLDGLTLTISKKGSDDENVLFFILNSRTSLVNYIANGLQVEPLVLGANTVRISFRDFNALKAQTIVNKLDSIYISYSHDIKSLTNRQKIEWLDNELVNIEKMMEDFENYFERFTIQNKSSDMREDLKKTIQLINQLDTQHYLLSSRIKEINSLIDNFSQNKSGQIIPAYSFLPASLNQQLHELLKMSQDLARIGMAYQSNTFTYQQKEREVNDLRDQVYVQLLELKKVWLEQLAEQTKKRTELEREFTTMPDKSTDYAKKQRFYKLYEEFYLTMMQSKAQFEITQAGSTPDFKILSPASFPQSPISPKNL